MDGMAGSQQLNVGCQEAVVPDSDGRYIEHGAVEIDKGIPADCDMSAVVTEKRRRDDGSVGAFSQKLFRKACQSLVVGPVRLIQLLQQPAAAQKLCQHFFIHQVSHS